MLLKEPLFVLMSLSRLLVDLVGFPDQSNVECNIFNASAFINSSAGELKLSIPTCTSTRGYFVKR